MCVYPETMETYENASVLATALHVSGSVIPQILCSPTTYVLTLINVGTMASVKCGYFHPVENNLHIHPHHSAMLTGLFTFFLVFYNGKVFTRYELLHQLMKDVSEFTIVLVAMVKRSVESKASCQELTRLFLASNFIFYFEITPDRSPKAIGNISQEEWSMLHKLTLLSSSEIQSLQEHIFHCHSIPGHATFVILHWSLILLMQHLDPRRYGQFEQRIHLLRDRQADVLALMELTMPFAYVHLLNFMLMITMLLLAFSMGMADSYLSVLIFFIVQLVFFGVRELSVALSDPFGIDQVDFPAVMWMTSVYNRCIAIANDDWDPSRRPGLEFSSLQKIDWGKTVLDLQVDLHDKAYGQADRIGWWESAGNPAGGHYQPLPTEDTQS